MDNKKINNKQEKLRKEYPLSKKKEKNFITLRKSKLPQSKKKN